jgi:hypothetical protein
MNKQHVIRWCRCAIVAAALTWATQSASGHGHDPPWLEPAALHDGIHVAVHYPPVLRAHRAFDVRVILRNVAGAGDVTVESIRCVADDGSTLENRRPGRRLPTRIEDYERIHEARQRMRRAAERHDIDAVQAAARECRDLLRKLSADAFTSRFPVPIQQVPTEPGARFRATIEITLVGQGDVRTIRRPIAVTAQSPLPTGRRGPHRWQFDVRSSRLSPAADSGRDGEDTVTWYAGDQHLHTTYSLDALVLSGTEETVTDYAAVAESIGLDWIIVTDHSNVHVTWGGTDYYTPEQFAEGTAQAAAYTAANPLLALYGQEMGAGRTGLLALPSHYLAYPFETESTGYLENPSSGLIFGLAYCEPEQVIIDRVNDAGGFGFIAHPFASSDLAYAEWDFDSGATGWSGLEIWNDEGGQIKATDDQALARWYELLNELTGPVEGVLPPRPDYPNPFPVGLGNSDAHEPGNIGNTFTYAWMPEFSREQVVNALRGGHCVASNGPLAYARLNGATIGDVALLLAADNELDVTLQTSPEFGPVGDYAITVYVNGTARTTIPPSGLPDYDVTVTLAGLNLAPPDRFVTVRADSNDGTRHAISNPVWLQFTTAGDANADGRIELHDFVSLEACLAGPDVERAASCDIMDFDRDRDVDLEDVSGFQQVFDLP